MHINWIRICNTYYLKLFSFSFSYTCSGCVQFVKYQGNPHIAQSDTNLHNVQHATDISIWCYTQHTYLMCNKSNYSQVLLCPTRPAYLFSYAFLQCVYKVVIEDPCLYCGLLVQSCSKCGLVTHCLNSFLLLELKDYEGVWMG